MNSLKSLNTREIQRVENFHMNSFLSRPTRALIDLRLYRENLTNIKNKVNKKIMAIIKANAYGHGLLAIGKEAEEIVDFFGVALLEEAALLRKNEIKKPILVLGYVDPTQYLYVAENNIRVAIYSYEQWIKWKQQIERYNRSEQINFHIKINSGMNRLGFKNKDEMNKTIKEIEISGAKIEGIFTHFATADTPGDPLIDRQETFFSDMIDNLRDKNYLIHIANSAYSLSRKTENLFDMVRVGISSYGLLPEHNLGEKMSVKTKPILQLKTNIINVQELIPGDMVGYGGAYQAIGNEKIGVIPIGYADGMLRRYSSESYVLVNGGKRKFVGRICMDQAMILLQDEDRVGDEVVIYGKQGNEEITLEMAGDWSNTINYEVACLLSERIRREYLK